VTEISAPSQMVDPAERARETETHIRLSWSTLPHRDSGARQLKVILEVIKILHNRWLYL
jgi:hypothetical protein